MQMTTNQKGRRNIDHRTRVGRERSARTEMRILDAARRVFAELGPDAPKIDDFVRAAGISRGTFYNHFDSVEELLVATSGMITKDILQSIDNALAGGEGPAFRVGLGLRLFFAMAQSDPVLCRFVARVWRVEGLDLPLRDLDEGLRLGVFRAPSAAAARDLFLGGVREALLRFGQGRTPTGYGEQMTERCLQALGTDSRRIAAVMKHQLPQVSSTCARQRAKDV